MVDVFTRMGHRVLIVKPKLDDRYGGGAAIHSHDNRSSKAIIVDGESARSRLLRKVLDSRVDKLSLMRCSF